jgi:hypothetical protein
MIDITSHLGFVVLDYPAELAGISDNLIAYCGRNRFSGADLVQVVRQHCDARGRLPTNIAVIAPDFRREQTKEALASDDFVYCQSEQGFAIVHTLLFGPDGQVEGLNTIELCTLQESILTALFTTRGGLLESTSAVHYIKPSQRHTDKFLRTGNVLQRSAEIEIIAWSCLSRLPPMFNHVYTDTGAINAIAYEIRSLLAALGSHFSFTIDSFNSYGGLSKFEPAPASPKTSA